MSVSASSTHVGLALTVACQYGCVGTPAAFSDHVASATVGLAQEPPARAPTAPQEGVAFASPDQVRALGTTACQVLSDTGSSGHSSSGTVKTAVPVQSSRAGSRGSGDAPGKGPAASPAKMERGPCMMTAQSWSCQFWLSLRLSISCIQPCLFIAGRKSSRSRPSSHSPPAGRSRRSRRCSASAASGSRRVSACP